MKIKEQFFDRFDQSFKLVKNNFVWLFIPVFVYHMLAFVIFTVLIWTFFLTKIGDINNIENFNIWLFLSDPAVVSMITVWIFVFLLYLLLYIVIILTTLKSIKKTVEWEKIDINESVMYWFSRFFSSMKTYWYMFVYVYLIPALVFIVWWILLNIWLFNNNDSMSYIWGWIMIVSLITWIVFVIYRWTKATFALYSAVDNDSFEKENFDNSIGITNRDWWRIFWNILFIWMIIGFWTSMIESAIWMFIFGLSLWWSVLSSWISELISWGNPENIIDNITQYFENKSIFYDIFKNLFSITLQSIWTVFIIVFTYLFYLRLYREDEYFRNKWDKVVVEEKNITKENIEL